MQLSQKRINKTLEQSLKKMLLTVLAESSSPDEIDVLLDSLLTEGERLSLLKRLGIALYLDKGRSYEDIKNNIMVSSATVASVAENLGDSGWQEMIRRIKADDWAEKWSKTITGKISWFFRQQ